MNQIKQTYLILGGTGQDGKLLTFKLIRRGFNVVQLNRNTSENNKKLLPKKYTNNELIEDNLKVINFDFQNNSVKKFIQVFEKYQPDYIVNFASTSSISESIREPLNCIKSGFNTHNIILEALRVLGTNICYLYAGSIEMFDPNNKNCNLLSPIKPSNPYSLMKALSYLTTQQYREIYSLNVMTAVFSNHESFLRTERFVTGKIFRTALRAFHGEEVTLDLASRSVKKDWGLASEYMDVIYEMLNQEKPQDRIIATGNNITLEEFTKIVFGYLNIDYRNHIKFSDKLLRPNDLFFREINKNELKHKIYCNITKKPKDMIKKLTDEWIKYGQI